MGGLWGGRFRKEMAAPMLRLNRSLGVDYRLWRQDIRGSRAWADALVLAGVITEEEGDLIRTGLGRVEERLASEDHSGAQDEDIHSLVERLLVEGIGEVGGKLHTGRSRNDQVATAFRLWGMEALAGVADLLDDLLAALVSRAEAGLDVVLPGHTHLQQAQPIRGAHWVLSHFWPLLRDRGRVLRASEAAGALPLGSAALAGCPFPVDREWLRKTLGFATLSQNSLDAVSDRDWAAEMAFAAALLGVHLSRLGEDLVLFSSREFGYLSLPEEFCTGSSIMPQKRNPDAAELIRGKTGRLLGNLSGFLALLKGLPSGYNRDLQEDKEFLFDTVDTLSLSLPVMTGVVAGMTFRPEEIEKRLDPALLSTDVADHLTRRGVPFRESHRVVGEMVRAAEEEGVSIFDLSSDVLRGIHPALEPGLLDGISFEASVEARNTPGGTSRAAVLRQLESARALSIGRSG